MRPANGDRLRSWLTIDELRDELGSRPSSSSYRCSDNCFLNMSVEDYLALLDWTARQPLAGKPGVTPADTPAIFERLGWKPTSGANCRATLALYSVW